MNREVIRIEQEGNKPVTYGEREKTIAEVINFIHGMDWGVMDNDISATELLKKLNEMRGKHYFSPQDENSRFCLHCGEYLTDEMHRGI